MFGGKLKAGLRILGNDRHGRLEIGSWRSAEVSPPFVWVRNDERRKRTNHKNSIFRLRRIAFWKQTLGFYDEQASRRKRRFRGLQTALEFWTRKRGI